MYTMVYKEIVAAGIAKETKQYHYYNKNNQIVEYDDVNKYGTLTNVQVTDPSYLLFVDESGSSANMKKDKTGSKRVIAEKGFAGTKAAITTDIRYTTMGFTAGTGEPVICCIIMTSESQKLVCCGW
jgi:hypothetical protein